MRESCLKGFVHIGGPSPRKSPNLTDGHRWKLEKYLVWKYRFRTLLPQDRIFSRRSQKWSVCKQKWGKILVVLS
jgi:hypothetical protein